MDANDPVAPVIAEFSTFIPDEVTTRFGEKNQRMNGVIAAGGGAYIAGQDLKATHPTHSNATIPTNPRFAVAERYARFGLCSTSAT